MKILFQLALFAVFLPTVCNGEENGHHSSGSGHLGVEHLSPELRGLLSQEMRQLQMGMTEIFPLYVSGRWAEISPIASKMENSYILKKSLTEKQIHELHSKLPSGFIGLDQQFHYLSGMLEHAAEMEKPELVGFYYSKMGEICVSCHTQYATHRFPALAPKITVHEH